MVASNEYLVRVGQFNEPVEKVKNLLLCTIVGKVTECTMTSAAGRFVSC